MSLAIFAIDDDYAPLADFSDSEAASATESFEDLLRCIEDTEQAVSDKLISLAKVVLTLKAEADVLEQHARDLLGRAAARRRRSEYLSRWMQLEMTSFGLDKVKDPFVTVWLQASPPSIDVLDEAAVPPDFKRVTLKLPLSQVPPGMQGLVQTCDVDRAGILALIELTGELPAGVSVARGRHLRIR